MRHAALTLTLITVLTLLAVGAPTAAAQSTCVAIAQGSGWGPVQLTVPSWATQLRADVAWQGLQLRLYVDGVVWGTDMYGDGSVRSVYTPIVAAGWGGLRTIEFWGIILDWVGAWTIYACGSPPPTPTPIPTPTPLPPATGPGCISRVGERPVWVGEGGEPSLTLYGPASGWWIVQVTQDDGASGAQYVGWRATTPSGLVIADRMIDGQIEVRSGMTVIITPYRTPLTGQGLVGVWVSITADCTGLVPTPLVPGVDDIREVEFGVEQVGERFCPIVLNRVIVSVFIPFWDTLTFEFPGVSICFIPRSLVLRWGDFNIVDWLLPLVALGLVWSAWRALRLG